MRQWAIVLGFVLGLTGCAYVSPIAVAVNPKVMQIYPPRVYRVWWKQMEECTGLKGDYNRWRFFMVEAPPNQGFWIEGMPAYALAGYTDRHSRIMYMDQEVIFSRGTVAHEMVHALGISGHPPVFERCGVA